MELSLYITQYHLHEMTSNNQTGFKLLIDVYSTFTIQQLW